MMPRTLPGPSSGFRNNGLTRAGLLEKGSSSFFGILAKRLQLGSSGVALNLSALLLSQQFAFDHLVCRHSANLLLLAGVEYLSVLTALPGGQGSRIAQTEHLQLTMII